MFKRKHRPPKWLRVIFDRESEKGLGRPWKETRARIERVIRNRPPITVGGSHNMKWTSRA